MDLARFFDGIRASVFGGRLTESAVDGCEAILASCRRHSVTDPQHVANILAQVHHETGGYMLPIKETVFASHKDKNPSDATVIARLDAAFAKGQLPWVKTPYWRDGWFGRGPIQITHEANYRKMGARLGVDLVGNPALALEPDVGADIAVVGMSEGLFTGRKLSDYRFPAALSARPAQNPRRIVNGQDGTDAKIAGTHRAFLAALEVAGWGVEAVPKPDMPIIVPPPIVVHEPAEEPAVPVPTIPTGGPKAKANGAAIGTTLVGPALLLAAKFGWIPADIASDSETVILLTAVIGAIGAYAGAYLAPRNAPA